MAVSEDNLLLAAGSTDKIIRVWCLLSAAPVAVLSKVGMMIKMIFVMIMMMMMILVMIMPAHRHHHGAPLLPGRCARRPVLPGRHLGRRHRQLLEVHPQGQDQEQAGL